MTTRTVNYCSFTKLPCATAQRRDVILCLQSSLLVVQPTTFCHFSQTTIEAVIASAYTTTDSCLNNLWHYVFEFNDDQLQNPSIPLVPGDIVGVFCRNCETDWIEEIVSCAGTPCVTDSATIDFSVLDACITGSVKLSADEGNVIEARVDGLYATGGGGGDAWLLLGNSGTVDGTNFIGTTDNVAHDVRVNNIRARRTVPTAGTTTSANIIDGYSGNTIADQSPVIAEGSAVLSGGGNQGFLAYNGIFGSPFTVICGGYGNSSVSSDLAFEGAGESNVIGGGTGNKLKPTASVNFDLATGLNLNNGIFAGGQNEILGQGNSVIVAGLGQIIDGMNGSLNFTTYQINQTNTYTVGSGGFIGGGEVNHLWGNFSDCAICSGNSNVITNAYWASFIGGGFLNFISNVNPPPSPTIPGNFAYSSCILGGQQNVISNGTWATILGGAGLTLTGASLGFQNGTVLNWNTNTDPQLLDATEHIDLRAFNNLAFFGDVDLWLGNVSGTASTLKLFSPNNDKSYSSAKYSSFRSQVQAATIEYVMPATAGIAGQQLTIDTVAGTVVTLKWA